MFKVPGWAISTDSLVQENSKGLAAETEQDLTSSKSSTEISHKRKRKPATESRTSKISGSELEQLWEARFGSQNSAQNKIQNTSNNASRPERAEKKKHTKEQHANPGTNETLGGDEGKISVQVDKKDKRGKGARNPKKLEQTSTQSSTKQNTQIKSSYQHGAQKHSHKQTIGATDDDNNARSHSANDKLQRMPPSVPSLVKLTPLQTKMRNKLNAARFRHINETLYTTSSADALELFNSSPDLFAEYHTGFSQQVKESWPQNPVKGYIDAIKTRGGVDETHALSGNSIHALPRRKTGSCTIADLGCGDASLARGCKSILKAMNLRFHNFDLHAANSLVTKADISNLPLREGEIDVVVFCLSLMGTNWISFVEEAWRILRGDGKGEVWVSEVKSRFGRISKKPTASLGTGEASNNKSKAKNRKQHKNSRSDISGEPQPTEGDAEDLFSEDDSPPDKTDETDISKFIQVFQRRGLMLQPNSVNKSNKMFVSMIFTKSGIPIAGKHKGLKWNALEKMYQPANDERVRFIDHRKRDEDISPEDEAKVLKPCVYKTR